MSEPTTTQTLVAAARDGGGRMLDVAATLAKSFASGASPDEILRLADLWKEVRQTEAEADVTIAKVDARKAVALRTLEAKVAAFEMVATRRLDKTDKALQLLVDKLALADDPESIAAVAAAIAQVASTDQLSDVAELLDHLEASDGLEF